ncbi:ABC transporter permease subunit [Burkholderia sp. Ax-1724]|uniref:amino acid ABC transporter permease n=1 Tax=Burkholderia sp. Ax-1724 TaxID=2608336 RepID=UPI0019632DB6|nr:ABC transporter permease subunit [Burkholderia sp. Ax-1724]
MNIQGLIFTFLNPDVIGKYYLFILSGMWVTVKVGVAVVATGLTIGFLLAFMRAAGVRAVNVAIIVFADVLRSLPPLVGIILLFFAFPYIGISMSAFAATWLALSLVLAAFAEEIFWAGLRATPKGLMEAGRSTGMSWMQTMWYVVWPHALKLTVPPLTNRVIAIVKGTALGAVVGLAEVLNNAQSATSSAGNATPLMMCAIGSLAIFLPVVLVGRYLERRFR